MEKISIDYSFGAKYIGCIKKIRRIKRGLFYLFTVSRKLNWIGFILSR
jgi:hypothetical protein